MVLDTNECGNANGGCEHYCNNTVGSFTCSCNTGFELAEDNLNCTGKKLQLTIVLLAYGIVSLVWHVSMQMLMSVLLVLIDVHRRVQTLLVAIGVVVVQDIL